MNEEWLACLKHRVLSDWKQINGEVASTSCWDIWWFLLIFQLSQVKNITRDSWLVYHFCHFHVHQETQEDFAKLIAKSCALLKDDNSRLTVSYMFETFLFTSNHYNFWFEYLVHFCKLTFSHYYSSIICQRHPVVYFTFFMQLIEFVWPASGMCHVSQY